MAGGGTGDVAIPATGRAKNSARRGYYSLQDRSASVLSRSVHVSIPRSTVCIKKDTPHLSMLVRPRRGSKPARANDGANKLIGRAEFFALPGHRQPDPFI